MCWPHDPDPINAGRELAALRWKSASRAELVAAYTNAAWQAVGHLGLAVADGLRSTGGRLIGGPGLRYLARRTVKPVSATKWIRADRLITALGGRVAAGDKPVRPQTGCRGGRFPG